MTIQHLPAGASAESVAAVIATDGCAVIDRLASPDLLDQLDAEMADYVERTPYGTDEFAGRRTRRTGGLIARSPTCRELVMHPLVLGTVEQRPRPRHELPAPPHAGDRDRPGRAGADDPPRSVGVRLLPVPDAATRCSATRSGR